ncbi:MAG: SCP2 sterol-binding domain-containing protein [Dethiobacteria bacterium]
MEEAKEMVLARLHLRAVLPLLEEIATYDRELQQLVQGWNAVIQFQLPGGNPATALIFQQGKLKVVSEDYAGPKVTLTFNNARELNKVFQGKSKKNPRPNAAAILHLSKLSKIDKVLGRLEHYLQPDEEMLKDPDFFAFCVKLSIFVMTFGIREIGEYDPVLKVISPGLPNGTLAIRIVDGPSSSITVKNGKFYPAKGPVENPTAILQIADLDTAWNMIQGKLDLFAAIGLQQIKIRGFMPLLDGINPLLDRLTYYL